MPFYNAGNFLRTSIESVLNQTFDDFEFLILDDGSTDGSANIVKEYYDTRINLVRLEHDFINTLNRGLELAKSKYIARMDADDVMTKSRLHRQFCFMEQHLEIDACGSWIQTFGDACRKVECLVSHEEIVNFMIKANPMAHPAMILRQSTLQTHRLRYDGKYEYAEDFKLWLEIAKIGRLANIPEILLHYRCSDEQVSVRKKDRQSVSTDKVRQEAIELFLNRINFRLPIAGHTVYKINEQLKELVNQSFISFDAYCQIMYAMAKTIDN
jgi:glycosyltransferase involved in cell wall biosynthesis